VALLIRAFFTPDALAALLPDVTVRAGEPEAASADTAVVITADRPLRAQDLAHAANLQLVITASVGFDHVDEVADLVETNAAEIARLDAIDAGKPIVDWEDIDVVDTVNTLRWYAEAVDKLFGRISPTGDDHLGGVSCMSLATGIFRPFAFGRLRGLGDVARSPPSTGAAESARRDRSACRSTAGGTGK
jgi:hypothetical protein